MKISIISPNLSGDVSIVDMGITYLATYLNQRTHHRALIIDFTYHRKDWKRHLEDSLRKYQPDLIGITCVSMYMRYVSEFIREVKERYGLPIILGGYHVTLMPEESFAMEGVDAICIGDGEFSLSEYLDCLEAGKSPQGIRGIWAKYGGHLVKNPQRELIQDIDSLPLPDYDLWEEIEKFIYYNGVMYFVGNRGCPFNCTYCSEFPMKNSTSGKYLRRRDPRAYAREVKYQWEKYNHRVKIKVAHFFDAVFPFDKEWLAEFCGEYKAIGLNKRLPFSCFTRADTIDEERIELMSGAGLKIARIGIEAGNERIRREIYEKNIPTDQYRKVARLLHKYGVVITGYNILGGPDETYSTMRDTFNLVKELKIERPIFFTYRPLPRTEGARKVLAYGGSIDTRMWKKIDSPHEYSNVYTRQLSPQQIVWFRRKCLFYFMSIRALKLVREQKLRFIINFSVYLIKGLRDGVGPQYIVGYFLVSGGGNCVH